MAFIAWYDIKSRNQVEIRNWDDCSIQGVQNRFVEDIFHREKNQSNAP